jgi:hypothetical protein
MASKKKLKTPKSPERNPDVVDVMVAMAGQLQSAGYPENQPIPFKVTVFVPVGGQEGGEIGIVKPVSNEQIKQSPHDEPAIVVELQLSKENVIELYKIVTGTHPEMKAPPTTAKISPMQIR